MTEYTIKGLTGTAIRDDRGGVTLHVDTDRGRINMTMTAVQLCDISKTLAGLVTLVSHK